ncbi:two-component sensor histidine kinase [Planotetraspora mira]|uniref:histidine kinase n=2 Tax=Planotetraspora mira TaxID=58121 RepID=A0A8J3TW63_9ACTN|nr:two-component sensor histidine kinase [Planotetraspora mira]
MPTDFRLVNLAGMDSTAGILGLGGRAGRAGYALRYVLITGRDRDLAPSAWGTGRKRYAQRALLVLAMAVLFASEISNGYLPTYGGAVAPIVVLLHMVPVLIMRRRPLTAWRFTVAGTVLTLAVAAMLTHGDGGHDLGTPWTAGMLLYLPVLMMTIARCPFPCDLAVAGISLLLVIPAGMAVGTGPLSGAGISGILAVSAATLAGLGVGRQDRIEQQLDVVNRSVAEEQTRRAVLEERARIVGELHDIIAHHLSLIAVRTESAPYRLAALRAATDDDPIRAEFAAVGDATRQALNETRQLLGVLRRDDDEVDLAPQPGLGDIDALVAEAHSSSVPATLTVHGHPLPVPPTVGLVLYRVVQEALSNARRHAPGAPVRVELRHAADQVRVTVDNDPPPRPVRPVPAGSGYGLAGMRERMAIVRGELAAAPRPDGGFTVSAAVPVTTDHRGALW